jgi:hypothetical protein
MISPRAGYIASYATMVISALLYALLGTIPFIIGVISRIAGFLAADNLRYLAEQENIHVCQGNIWSQHAVDNGDGDGSISYPYYPSTEHFCKPARGEHRMLDAFFCAFSKGLRGFLCRKDDNCKIDPFWQGMDGGINRKAQKLSPFRVDEIQVPCKFIGQDISNDFMARFTRSRKRLR